MAEGWSDFFACLLLGTEVIGAWAPAPGQYRLLAAVILIQGTVLGIEAGPPLQVVP